MKVKHIAIVIYGIVYLILAFNSEFNEGLMQERVDSLADWSTVFFIVFSVVNILFLIVYSKPVNWIINNWNKKI